MPVTISIWPKVFGTQKFTYCKNCGRRIKVENFNQKLCADCGYKSQARCKHA